MTTRDFGMVDQDQSDNVITTYLINGNGQTAQNTAANAGALAGATTLANGSDNKLLAAFLDAANGCTDFHATDATDPTGMSGSQALNELSARVNQKGTIAAVPPNDEMTLVAGAFSIAKTNVYRSLVDQPLLAGNVNATQVAVNYCQNLVNIQPARNQLDMTRELAFGTPVAAVGNSLATFMGNRLSHVVRQPRLRQLRPGQPGHRHPRRQPGGHRGHLQHRGADGEPGRPRRPRRTPALAPAVPVAVPRARRPGSTGWDTGSRTRPACNEEGWRSLMTSEPGSVNRLHGEGGPEETRGRLRHAGVMP